LASSTCSATASIRPVSSPTTTCVSGSGSPTGRQKQEQYPELEIHQVEAGAPEQFRQLASGRLNVGIGRVSLVPPEVISELFRLDPLGMLGPEGHRLAASQEVPVAKLAAQLAPSRRSCAGVVGAA
jgi:DNA-binding transcriptional LysR family regulator